MDFLNLPFDMQLEILKYNPRFRGINKKFYNNGYHVYIEYYKNKKITFNEILNYKERYYLYSFNNNVIYYINPIKNGSVVYRYLLKSYPQGIDPNFYSTNLTLEHDIDSFYNTHNYKNMIYRLKSPCYIDMNTKNNMMVKRNIPKKDITYKVLPISLENDYIKMYSKISLIIYLSSIDKVENLLDKHFKFKFGHIVERFDEYNEYMKKLDLIIEEIK